MAVYKNADSLQQSTHHAFDIPKPPGYITQYGGIYRCTVCGRELAACAGVALPGEENHVHAPGMGPIVWQLLVAAN